MATKYLLNTATGAADGTSWADAYTTLTAAFAGMSAGDTLYVRSTHTENTSADKSYTSPGTAASPCYVVSVNASDVYTEATTPQFSTSTTSDSISLLGHAKCFGVYFSGANEIIMRAPWSFFEGTLKGGGFAGQAAGLQLFFTDDLNWSSILLKNVVLNTANADGTVAVWNNGASTPICIMDGCILTAHDVLVSADALLVTMFTEYIVRNMDLSTLTTLCNNINAAKVSITNCRLPASYSKLTTTISASSAGQLNIESCDNGDTKQYYYYQDGWDTTEYNTTVSRSATDGTTPFSTKIITKASQDHLVHSRRKIATMYVDTADYTTDITFTVHVAREDVAAVFDNKEVWIDVIHPDGDIQALGVEASTGVGVLDTATSLTSTSGNWTGLGGTNQEMAIAKTITIGASAGNIASGVVEVWLNVAKASQTLYVCPRIDLT